MKTNAIVYMAIGIIAIIGAALCAYLLLMLGDAVSLINSAGTDVPPGTDLAGLQENARMIGTVVMWGWIFTISFIVCGVLTLKNGVDAFRRKK